MSARRRTRALARAAGVAIAFAGVGLAACGDDASSEKLERDPSWLVPCAVSSECAIGQCVCGVCSEPCGAGTSDGCSAVPEAAACFARGSIAHAALCGGGDVDGLCLPSCRRGDDCGTGFSCDVGACMPAASVPLIPPGSATSEAYAEVLPASWPDVTPPESGPLRGCDDPARCPTLEALLRTDSCFEVVRGCGITYLNAHDGRNGPGMHYWYDAFGAPPLLQYEMRSGNSLGSSPVACDGVEKACWTCATTQAPRVTALGAVLCAEVPGIWPEPAPALDEVPGCACEPDADGARVSLDCFCGLYPCPSQDELLSGCASRAEPGPVAGATLDASGQLWLSNARYAGQRYTFDASGAIVGAIAFSQGPATLPCNTDWVGAGAARAAEVSEACECQSSIACSGAPWFPASP